MTLHDMIDHEDSVTRRAFLIRLSYAAAFAPLLGACRSESKNVGAAAAGVAPAQRQESGCTDVSGLTAEQKQTRKALQYVDRSPHDDKKCNNCRLFNAPSGGKACGTCQVVPGPIHPKGYCTAWTAA